jgi:hypothetical protein
MQISSDFSQLLSQLLLALSVFLLALLAHNMRSRIKALEIEQKKLKKRVSNLILATTEEALNSFSDIEKDFDDWVELLSPPNQSKDSAKSSKES